MAKKIKEQLIKWSRNVEKVENFSRFITLILIVVFVPIVFYDFGVGIFSEKVFNILFVVLKIMICIAIFILIFKDILITIRSKEDINDSGTKLMYIIFSNRTITEDIIISLLFANFLLPFAHLRLPCYFILLIAHIILPGRVAKYFEGKLKK